MGFTTKNMKDMKKGPGTVRILRSAFVFFMSFMVLHYLCRGQYFSHVPPRGLENPIAAH